MNPIALRLLNQQLVAPQFREPEEVVRHMGAMQAQEYRMMRWAVTMRTRRPSMNDGKQNAGNKTQGCRATFFMGEHTADDVLVEWTRYKNT